MKKYTHNDAPLKVFGVPFFEEKRVLERLPEEIRTEIPTLAFLGRRTAGARIGFRTNSKNLTVRISLETFSVHLIMSIYGCQSAVVCRGNRNSFGFMGVVFPPDYNTKTYERAFTLSGTMQDIMIYLPRNEIISFVEIEVDDDACVEAPTPYKNGTVVYYGSSITEGGCCTRPNNAYTAILSDRLDFDYYNLGFSGNCKGELAMADYISSIPMDVFVYDYDHNAPNSAHLKATHEPFFKRFREKHPLTPVLMISKPDFMPSEDNILRRSIIKETYDNAVRSGDKNVWFIDGEEFFKGGERGLCTVDGCHPNDLGMYKMANVIEPVLREMLGICE